MVINTNSMISESKAGRALLERTARSAELDTATGMYYYGARYYDPRLSIFISVDPLAEETMTPYQYVHNNPINMVDPTGMKGEDWIIKSSVDNKGNKTITMTLVGAVYNDSNQDIDMNKFVNTVKSQLQQTYEGVFYESRHVSKSIGQGKLSQNINYESFSEINLVIDVQLRVINNIDHLKSNEHLLQISKPEDLSGSYGKVNKIGGKQVFFNANKINNMMNGLDNNTIPHELGHTLGLRHIDAYSETFGDLFGGNPQFINPQEQSKNSTNIMFSGKSKYMNDQKSIHINSNQMNTILRNYRSGNLNKE